METMSRHLLMVDPRDGRRASLAALPVGAGMRLVVETGDAVDGTSSDISFADATAALSRFDSLVLQLAAAGYETTSSIESPVRDGTGSTRPTTRRLVN
jgi:hypothetical protein